MKITRGEYCQFSLKGRLQLLTEFGEFLGEETIENKSIRLYRLYDFYVEVLSNKLSKHIEKAEPIKCFNTLLFYNSLFSR